LGEAVLVPVRVDAKSNQHKAALGLLGGLPVKGRVVLGDAKFCQREVCQAVRDRAGTTPSSSRTTSPAGGPTSPPASATRRPSGPSRPPFPPDGLPPPAPGRVATTTDTGHDRREQRTLRTTTALTVHRKGAGLKQGFALTRTRTVKGETTVEVIYGITSLTEQQAGAARLLALARGHGGIENQRHYVRDVTRGEDGCRVRKGAAPQVLAAVRNAVLHRLAGVRAPRNAAAIRRLNHHPEEALALVDLPQA
jgi:predicted transposase YbfD/YdcC